MQLKSEVQHIKKDLITYYHRFQFSFVHLFLENVIIIFGITFDFIFHITLWSHNSIDFNFSLSNVRQIITTTFIDDVVIIGIVLSIYDIGYSFSNIKLTKYLSRLSIL